MWNPSSRLYKYYNIFDKSILAKSKECMVLPKRNVNDGRIESRVWRSKSGWFSRKGTRPGYPASWPESRVVGVDLNLQVSNSYDINFVGKTVLSHILYFELMFNCDNRSDSIKFTLIKDNLNGKEKTLVCRSSTKVCRSKHFKVSIFILLVKMYSLRNL